MKRVGNLYRDIISIENLKIADKKAKKGKLSQYGVKQHLKREQQNIEELHEILNHNKFKTSDYHKFEINEGKKRIIARLPYYPDRILHHAIVNKLEPLFVSVFTADTYSCIKQRGVHKASYSLRKALQDRNGTQYCLKLDIRKFYNSVNLVILKQLLRKKIKDVALLNLLDEIIDSYDEGIPLGSLLSQFLGNYYLTYFDHWIKEELKVKYYFRYCDDMVILSDNKEELHLLFTKIEAYLNTLKLEVKRNWQVFPVNDRGIDFCGYKHYHTHTLIRKSIKKNYIKNNNKKTHFGWMCHANTINLRKKYENNEN
jgi:RNA-directed DNA polymerase